MRKSISSLLFMACIAGGMTMLAPGAFPARAAETSAAQNSQYGKFYFKKWEAWNLDSSQVAVKARDLASAQAAAAKAGIPAAGVREWGISGWWLLDAPAQAKIEGLVAQLAAMPELDFASPVFFSLPLGAQQKRLPVFPTNEIDIGFNEGTPAANRDAVLANSGAFANANGALLDRDWGGMAGVDRIRSATKNGFDVMAQANALAQRADTRFAEPDMMISGMNELVPNDPLYGGQWALNNGNDMDMNVPEAWDITQGASNIIVMVIDVGVQLAHPDLNMLGGGDFTGNGTGGNPGNACDKHGTACAGCISARTNNSLGVAGVAGGCRVYSARCFVSSLACDGSWSADYNWTVNAINTAVANGYRVTSNSNIYGGTLAAMDTAYTNSHNNNGIVHFAAAGNNGTGSIAYPASSPSVNACMAIDSNGNKASFSQYGTGTKFAGPGVGITTTDRTGTDGYVNGDYANVDGTSFACPNSAAVAALVISRNPALTAAQVESIMYSTCKDRGAAGYDTVFGYGIPDAWRALRAALPRPANDDCGSAIDVSATGQFFGNLNNATFYTPDGAADCGSSPYTSPDVWYTFTAPSYAGGTLRVTTCGTNDTGGVDAGIDTVLAILNTCGGSVLTCNDDWWNAPAGVIGCSGIDNGNNQLDSAAQVVLAAGQTVKIRVSRYGGLAAGNFTLNVFFTLANDTCAGAIPVGLGTITGNTTLAALDGSCGCITTTNRDVFYSFTPTCTGLYRLDTCGSAFDTVLSVHTGCNATAANQIACNDDNGFGGAGGCAGSLQSSLNVFLVKNTPYIIRVAGFFSDRFGAFTLNIAGAAPTNDTCAGATVVSDGVFDYGNCYANSEIASTNACRTGYLDLWYAYRAPCDGTATISTCNGEYDTVLMAFNGCPSNTTAPIACNDDTGGTCGPFGLGSTISFPTTSGSVYMIRLAAFGNSAGYRGSGQMVISCEPTNPCGCAADYNQDGGIDGADVGAFFDDWTAAAGCSDVNQDGGIDGADVGAFFDVWQAGGC